MTSQINPSNIDATYPVAGQPNNTQGFRDNFTATQTNFGYAKNEITDLQTKAVLKAALTGTTLDNNMNDALLYAAKIQDFSATAVSITTTSGPVAVDYTTGHYQSLSPSTGSVSLSFTKWPASGSYGLVRLRIYITNTAYTVTLPAAATQGVAGIQGYAANIITFGATGYYEFEFSTVDGGTTITVVDLNRPLLASAGNYIGYSTGSGGTVTQSAITLGGVVISGTGGTFTCSAAAKTLVVGDTLTISGTYGGSGSISGYANPTTYYVIATNGSTTFTLSASLGGGAITTTAGTPSGLTYTVNSKTYGVTLNKPSGQITTTASALGAAAETSFTLTNSTIAATDVVYVCIASGATAGAYNVQVDAVAAGSCQISISNLSAGTLSQALVLNFVVIKAVAA